MIGHFVAFGRDAAISLIANRQKLIAKSQKLSGFAPAALFVFLAGAAGTGVVAVDFDGGAAFGQVDFDLLTVLSWGHGKVASIARLGDVSLGGGSSGSKGSSRLGVGITGELLRQTAHEVLKLLEVGGGAEQVVKRLVLDAGHEDFKE